MSDILEKHLLDQLYEIIVAKKTFIIGLDITARNVNLDNDDLIDLEQRFDDMLYKPHRRVTEELGIYEPLPMSKRYQEWLSQKMNNRIVTNPATLIAKGML